MVPGMTRVARSRSAGVRKRYVSDSLASSRPATFKAALRRSAGATADAACGDPISSTPSDRPFGDVDQACLEYRETVRRRVLVELVEHREAHGRRPVPSSRARSGPPARLPQTVARR